MLVCYVFEEWLNKKRSHADGGLLKVSKYKGCDEDI
jgi:hypothetical protein